MKRTALSLSKRLAEYYPKYKSDKYWSEDISGNSKLVASEELIQYKGYPSFTIEDLLGLLKKKGVLLTSVYVPKGGTYSWACKNINAQTIGEDLLKVLVENLIAYHESV